MGDKVPDDVYSDSEDFVGEVVGVSVSFLYDGSKVVVVGDENGAAVVEFSDRGSKNPVGDCDGTMVVVLVLLICCCGYTMPVGAGLGTEVLLLPLLTLLLRIVQHSSIIPVSFGQQFPTNGMAAHVG